MSLALYSFSNLALSGPCCPMPFTAGAVTSLIRLHRHDRRQQGEPFRGGACLVIPCPTFGFAFDALAVGEILSRAGGPVRAVDVVVVPEFLRARAALGWLFRLTQIT